MHDEGACSKWRMRARLFATAKERNPILADREGSSSHVELVKVPHAGFVALRWWRQVVAPNVGVHAVVARHLKLCQGMFDTNAGMTKLGDLGRVCVVEMMMPALTLSQRSKLVMCGSEGVVTGCGEVGCFVRVVPDLHKRSAKGRQWNESMLEREVGVRLGSAAAPVQDSRIRLVVGNQNANTSLPQVVVQEEVGLG